MNINLHSYTFREYPLKHAFQCAQRFGYDGIELQPVHFRENALGLDLPQCVALGKQYDVPVRCVDFRGDFISDDEKTVYNSVDQLEKNIEICARYDIRLMNGHCGMLAKEGNPFRKNGSALATREIVSRAVESLKYLCKVAEKNEVILSLEIHMNTIHDTVGATRKLLRMIDSPNLRATPDPGNMFATKSADADPVSLDKIAEFVEYVHFKNCAKVGDVYDYSVRLSDGHIDTYKYIQKLLAMGYAGDVCIEYCGEGDPHVAAEKDIAYFRRCLEWAGSGA